MSEEKKTIGIKEPLATISDRILATIIDFIIVDLIVIICLVLPFAIHLSFVLTAKPVLQILLIIFWPLMSVIAALSSSAYFIFWPIKTNGLTIGKKAMGIRLMIIADIQSGKLHFVTKNDNSLNFKRFIFSFVDMQFFGGIGMLLMNRSPINQTFADEKLNTVVIESEDLEKETLDKMIAAQVVKLSEKSTKKELEKKVKTKNQDEEE